ncbi:DUF1329 domain-containing protein [Halomonas sp. PR-M31]|uniref:DUF1329 domain-containing protein n=1 Tax=Halomonas sp. PR-M31 TaxID=1471202 RepID=UPI000651EB4D|nr:DUF1329 domain-containing protein [Halomonas sp. PR-M31]
MSRKYPALVFSSLFTLALFPSITQAAVSAQEVQKLGNELTCVGAVSAGNKEGTIPPFSGKWLGTPSGMNYDENVGQHPINPYRNDTPIFVITGDNWRENSNKLTPGQQAMFEQYPQTFEMPIYPGRRDFRYPPQVCDIAKRNALEAELTDGGLGFSGYKGAVPFPVTEQPLEVLMNTYFLYRAYTESMPKRDIADISASGNITWGQTKIDGLNVVTRPENMGEPIEGVMAYYRSEVLLPTRNKGSITISSEPTNFVEGDRLAWNYNPGTRRVRQMPEYGFDSAADGTSGKVTIDQDRLMNGSPIRYNWSLKGKKEIYIPANAYRIHSNDVSYDDLLIKHHANPDYMRYELRRVWVLEGSLKQQYRHKYGKRVMYIDEDTWHGIVADYYDTRDQLVQHAFINYYYAFDAKAWHAGTSFYHDLATGGYVAFNLFQDLDKGPILNKGGLSPDMYTPAALRASGY